MAVSPNLMVTKVLHWRIENGPSFIFFTTKSKVQSEHKTIYSLASTATAIRRLITSSINKVLSFRGNWGFFEPLLSPITDHSPR